MATTDVALTALALAQRVLSAVAIAAAVGEHQLGALMHSGPRVAGRTAATGGRHHQPAHPVAGAAARDVG
jgi:hypothetical protein